MVELFLVLLAGLKLEPELLFGILLKLISLATKLGPSRVELGLELTNQSGDPSGIEGLAELEALAKRSQQLDNPPDLAERLVATQFLPLHQ